MIPLILEIIDSATNRQIGMVGGQAAKQEEGPEQRAITAESEPQSTANTDAATRATAPQSTRNSARIRQTEALQLENTNRQNNVAPGESGGHGVVTGSAVNYGPFFNQFFAHASKSHGDVTRTLPPPTVSQAALQATTSTGRQRGGGVRVVGPRKRARAPSQEASVMRRRRSS